MSNLLDADEILSENDQWMKLEEEWGNPVDLDTEEDFSPSRLKPVFSSLDLRRTTFDSSFLFKKVRHQVSRKASKCSILKYKDFLQDLQQEPTKDVPPKQFYFINGQILSAFSVEEICNNIDEIFKSVEKLCSATSTIRNKKVIPEVVHCSISIEDLSFDDTKDTEKEKSDGDDIDRYIDEAFEQLNYTIVTISNREDLNNVSNRESVTTLVRKFSSILSNPAVNRSPRRHRQCCDRFKDLAEYWQNRAFEDI